MDQTNPGSLGEDFVNVVSEKSRPLSSLDKSKHFFSQWVEKVSAPTSVVAVVGANALKSLYPKHSLVISEDDMLDILHFPGVQTTPLEKVPLITNLFFVPVARRIGTPGLLVDNVQFGMFKINWQQHEFAAYIVSYPFGQRTKTTRFILHAGSEDVTRLFLASVGQWVHEAHDEIWVFDGTSWNKSHSLWAEVQKADWEDVILKDQFKEALQKDVYGFFDSEEMYKNLGIPWKRGLIMYGPPGNGKTITLKAIMKTCSLNGFLPLYVRTFKGWAGEEAAMKAAFNKARELSPCVVILEDLDSLISDQNRSFFLNQLDGLEGNEGLLIIGTTNHFDKLDPGINARPSRFDRKYLFDNPEQTERRSYALYWQKKLSSNKDILFPDTLADSSAALTAGFSFAYLKEAFVSSLVLLAGMDGKKPSFGNVLKGQIAELRKQLNSDPPSQQSSLKGPSIFESLRGNYEDSSGLRDVMGFLRNLPEPSSQRVFTTTTPTISAQDNGSGEQIFRDLIDRLSSSS